MGRTSPCMSGTIGVFVGKWVVAVGVIAFVSRTIACAKITFRIHPANSRSMRSRRGVTGRSMMSSTTFGKSSRSPGRTGHRRSRTSLKPSARGRSTEMGDNRFRRPRKRSTETSGLMAVVRIAPKIMMNQDSYLKNDELLEPHLDLSELLRQNNHGIAIFSGTINGLFGQLFDKGKFSEIKDNKECSGSNKN